MNRRNFLLSTASISALPFIPAVPAKSWWTQDMLAEALPDDMPVLDLMTAQRWQNAWMSTALQRIMTNTRNPYRIIQEPSISDDSDDYEPDYTDEYDL